MMPVALLDIEPHHAILDMCASPGSKTIQAIEALYAHATDKEGAMPTGFVVANELDAERSYVLAKRCGALRAAAASCVVTCHRAQIFPAPPYHCAGFFDRIVCDVPCSGFSPLLQKAVCLEVDPMALRSAILRVPAIPAQFTCVAPTLFSALIGETDLVHVPRS